mgnify:FL=1
MLKKLLIFFIALAPIAAVAQDAKIAYINVQEVFTSMPELSAIETQLAEKQEQINNNGQALINEFNKKLEEFEATAETASDALKIDQQKQLESIQERYQLFQQNSQQEMGQLQQKLFMPLQQKVNDAIKAIGDSNNFTYVLDVSTMPSPIVYVNPNAKDITQEVKTKLGI